MPAASRPRPLPTVPVRGDGSTSNFVPGSAPKRVFDGGSVTTTPRTPKVPQYTDNGKMNTRPSKPKMELLPKKVSKPTIAGR